jgi:hypothetical protein
MGQVTGGALVPTREDRFSFGLWTVGHPGHDPFGAPTRPPLDPCEIVHQLADLGASGVSFHDDDLVSPDATAQARQLVSHGHFMVNSRKVDIPSYIVKSGDVIQVRERSRTLEPIKMALETVEQRGVRHERDQGLHRRALRR